MSVSYFLRFFKIFLIHKYKKNGSNLSKINFTFDFERLFRYFVFVPFRRTITSFQLSSRSILMQIILSFNDRNLSTAKR